MISNWTQPGADAPEGRRSLALDEINHRIIQVLSHKGRCTMRELADAVGRTESTVRDRVATLEMHGVLTGYAACVDWAQVGLPVTMVVEGYLPPGQSDRMALELERVPNLVSAVVTTGSPNVLAIVRASDIHGVRKTLVALGTSALLNVQVRIMLEQLVAERQPREATLALARMALEPTVLAPPALAPRSLASTTLAPTAPAPRALAPKALAATPPPALPVRLVGPRLGAAGPVVPHGMHEPVAQAVT